MYYVPFKVGQEVFTFSETEVNVIRKAKIDSILIKKEGVFCELTGERYGDRYIPSHHIFPNKYSAKVFLLNEINKRNRDVIMS